MVSLREERANSGAFRAFYSIWACLVLSVFSSSSCLRWAAACDCGTLWTFLLLFCEYTISI